MELNNLPLQLSIEDFMEDGNMIQLKFKILGYLKKEDMTVNKVLLNLLCQIIWKKTRQ